MANSKKRSITEYFKPITNQPNTAKRTTAPAHNTRSADKKKTTTTTTTTANTGTAMQKTSPLSSLSSLSSLDEPTPRTGTGSKKQPKQANTKKNSSNQPQHKPAQPNGKPQQQDIKHVDDKDDELPDQFGCSVGPTAPARKSHTAAQSHVVTTTTSSDPSCRRSARIISSTNSQACGGGSASASSSAAAAAAAGVLQKLKKPLAGISNNKFSLEQMLKDKRARAEKQATLKRTRQALGLPTETSLASLAAEFDHQIPDVFPDLTEDHQGLRTPQKKSKNSHPNMTRTGNRMNAVVCAQDPSSHMADLLLDTTSPSKSLQLDEHDLDCLDHQSNTHKTKFLKKLLKDDLASGQQNGLNRGLAYRQLFHPALLEPSFDPADPALPTLDYASLEGVSKHPDVLDFVQELIDNLEYSIKCPDALPVDLTQVIPEELTASGISDESGMMMTHQTILGVLFRPLVDPAYPLAVAERSLLLMRTLLGTFAATPYLNRLSEFWLATLQDALCRLGLRPQHVYFGSYPPEGQSSLPFAFGLNDSIERIRLLLRLFIILSSTSYLNDRGRIWAMTIALRVGLEPTSSELRGDVVAVIEHVLSTVYHGLGMEQQQTTTKESKMQLMVETLKVGMDMHTWTNQLELVRLVPAHLPFRKALVIGLVDLAVCHHADDHPHPLLAHDDGLYKMAHWLSHITNRFTTAPTPREIFCTIKEVFRRPYEQKLKDGTEGVAGMSGSEVCKGAETDAERAARREQEEAEIGRTMKAGKFRTAFARYLGPDHAINEAQFTALIMLFQIALQALWDRLVEPSVPQSAAASSSASSKRSSNVWITLIHQSLEFLDHSIKSGASPSHQADRIKLKNAVLRLATALSFLNHESFLVVKGVDHKGQLKLDKFFKKQ